LVSVYDLTLHSECIRLLVSVYDLTLHSECIRLLVSVYDLTLHLPNDFHILCQIPTCMKV
jgi:hypothetical protein